MDSAGTFSDPLSRTVLDSLSAHIAILDQTGVILATNRAWQRFASNSGSANVDSVGFNYLAVCDAAMGDDADDAQAVAAGIRSVVSGREAEFLYDYPCHSPNSRHWYYVRVLRLIGVVPIQVVVTHEEITALKESEEALRRREAELREQKTRLEESNIAMRVLLKQREDDRLELEQTVVTNLRQRVMPYLEALKAARLKSEDRRTVALLDAQLQEIVSPFLQRLSNAQIMLTPQEIQVAAMVKDGKASRDIADALGVSITTVHFHRKNLRNKFGLTNQRTNLRTYLMSLVT